MQTGAALDAPTLYGYTFHTSIPSNVCLRQRERSDGDTRREPRADRAVEESAESVAIRTFLIADIRGYTRFTLEHEDDVAARLAAHFAQLARQVVTAHDGRALELRGDEALAVFTAARQALRAAVAFQAACGVATEEDPSLPLRVGVGLDAGEAAPVQATTSARAIPRCGR